MNAITNPSTIVMDSAAVSTALATGRLPVPSAPAAETAAAPEPDEVPAIAINSIMVAPDGLKGAVSATYAGQDADLVDGRGDHLGTYPVAELRPAELDPGMAVTCTVKDMRAALTAAGKVVSRSTIHLLEAVRIDAADTVTVTGTDMYVTVTAVLPAEVYTAGSVILPLKALKQTLVRRKAGEAVSVEVVPALPGAVPSARVTVGDTEFTMSGFDTDEWPEPESMVDGEVADIPGSALAAGLADCAAAQSVEETRYYLRGVLFERTDSAFLRLAATDGHRLHVHDTGWHWPAMGIRSTDADTGETVSRDARLIVPSLAIAALQHLLKGATIADDVVMESDGIRATFESDGWSVATKLVDGSYPDFDRILSGAFPDEIAEPAPTVHHAELAAAPTLATMQAIKSATHCRSNTARLHFAAGEITAGSIDSGDHSRHPMARVNGECALEVIGLNAEYMADVAERIAAQDGATMALTMTNKDSPIGITSADKPGFLAVVMPPRV